MVALANVALGSGKARADVNIAMADLNRWLSCDINADTRTVKT